VKRISDVLLRTEGTTLKLFTSTHETTQLFHVLVDNFDCRYDGILGQDFWKGKGATISYCNSMISMGEVIMNFDSETNQLPERKE